MKWRRLIRRLLSHFFLHFLVILFLLSLLSDPMVACCSHAVARRGRARNAANPSNRPKRPGKRSSLGVFELVRG